MIEPAPKHAITAEPAQTRAEQDQRLELAIAMLLRVGVIVAALLVVIGGALLLRHPHAPVPNYQSFHPPRPGDPNQAISSIAGVFRQLPHDSGAGIIALGLLVLIATPIARVAFAAAGFARERDTLYTAVSLIVLAILLFSLVHGH